jgi:hypothetical protein
MARALTSGFKAQATLRKRSKTASDAPLPYHAGIRSNQAEDQKAAIAVGWYDIHEEEAAKRKKATRFAPDESPNPGGKPKSEVRPDSDEPEERDYKKENATRASAVTAAAASVSRYKVEQAIAGAR